MTLKKQNNLIGVGLVLLCVSLFATPVLMEYLHGYDFINVTLALAAGVVFFGGLLCLCIGARQHVEDAPATPLPEWQQDGYGTYVYRQGDTWVWILKRPYYCDRGHYIANCEGIPSIDDGDAFPRYFMNLERAKAEMREWLDWRIATQLARG